MTKEAAMAKDPRIGYKVVATVISVKGDCSAGYEAGDSKSQGCCFTAP